MLSVGEKYSEFCNSFVSELINNTPYDIKITTDYPEKFDASNSRLIIDHVDISSHKIKIGSDFNYNLKHLCFREFDSKYETIFYLDCDQKIEKFNSEEAERILDERYKQGYDFLGTRTNAILEGSLIRFKNGEHELFRHKILNYDLINNPPPTSWLSAKMPSEHFFIMKNSPKVKAFYESWKDLNNRTEGLAECHGVWGDGFEIGVAAAVAEFNVCEVDNYEQYVVFGIIFNGNKR